jgi:hypothetical protein
MAFRVAFAFLMMAAAAACSSASSRTGPTDAYMGSSYRNTYGPYTMPATYAPRLDDKRKIVEQDCSKPLANNDGNLRCK